MKGEQDGGRQRLMAVEGFVNGGAMREGEKTTTWELKI